MTELNALKEPYINLSTIETGNLTPLELYDNYINTDNQYLKDVYIAKLIIYCWPALEKLYYGQNTKVISLTDCYDIFMDSFLYVMEKHVWKDSEHSLYNDEDAILKAMYVLVESRRCNYFVAQNRQKRAVNQYPVSLDSLSDEFQEGYFSYSNEHYNFNRGWDKEFINDLWENKKYITAIIFDCVINLDVFEDEGLNIKKLKKYVKNISENHYLKFIDKYDIMDDDLNIYHTYIQGLNDDIIYTYIDNAISDFKNNVQLKRIKDNNVD